MDTDNQTLNQVNANRLKKIRDLLGYSQREMAEELQVVHGTIGLWEAGSRSIPGPVLRLMELYERELGIHLTTHQQDTLSSLETSWFKRTFKLSSLSAQFTAQYIWNHLKGVVGKKHQDNIKSRTQKALALKIADSLSKMKGLPMKLGQMVSYMDFHAPDLKNKSFSELQFWSHPLDPATIAEIIVGEFKKTPGQLFKKWTPTPFAAASIGQVHRAQLDDDTKVAVKIQYPDILKLIKNDLVNAEIIDTVGSTLFAGQEAGVWVSELRERLIQECNYSQELANQETFYRIYQNDNHIIIPKVFRNYSSSKIITSSFEEGESFDFFIQNANQEERDFAAQTILRFSFGSLFKHHILNGDPHPGNYLFKDKAVVFLDYGCVKNISKEFTQLWARFLKALIHNDKEACKEVVIAFNVAPNPDQFDFDYHFTSMRQWYTPLLEPNTVIDPAFMQQQWNQLVIHNPNIKKMNVPPDWVLVNHLNWGIYSVLAHLKARVCFRDYLVDLL